MAGPSPQSDKQVAWKSLIAGGVAGGIEGFCTYPAEFAKTRLQLQSRSTIGSSIQINKNPLKLLRDVIKNDGFFAIYAGCSAMVIGNTWKAAVRFLTFDQVRNMFKDSKGNISAIGGIFAGFSAGLIESLVAVTPFETIKTALYVPILLYMYLKPSLLLGSIIGIYFCDFLSRSTVQIYCPDTDLPSRLL